MKELTNQRKESLGNNTFIFISKEYSFTTDSLLLAEFSSPKFKEKILEIGSGCGVIPLTWCRDDLISHVDAVEIQENACNLFRRSILENKYEKKINLVNGDIKEVYKDFSINGYDIIVCNPPYKTFSSGLRSNSESRRIARHECSCSLNDIVRISSKLLKYGGVLSMCNRSERLCDVICCMRENGIEPKIIKIVQQREGKPSKFFLIKGKKGAKPGISFMPVLIIEGVDNQYSEEMKKIYGSFQN